MVALASEEVTDHPKEVDALVCTADKVLLEVRFVCQLAVAAQD